MLRDEEIFALLPKEEDELAFARAVEQAAYERAAQQCEIVRHGMERHQEYAEACLDCAHEIRSLIQEQPK